MAVCAGTTSSLTGWQSFVGRGDTQFVKLAVEGEIWATTRSFDPPLRSS
jgi:hypothetical protein